MQGPKQIKLDDEYYLKVFHDLRSGLTIMGGYTSLLMEEGESGLNGEQKEFLLKIRKGYRDTLSLLNDATDLIVVKRISESPQKKNIELKEIINKAETAAKAELKEKNITLEQNLPDNSMMFNGEEELMVRAVYHCLIQIILFSPKDSIIKINAAPVDGGITVSINCGAANIPAEKIPNLFMPFFADEFIAKFGKKKVGLSMAIVKEIMKLHNGKVLAESSTEEGLKITLQIPAL